MLSVLFTLFLPLALFSLQSLQIHEHLGVVKQLSCELWFMQSHANFMSLI